MDVIPSIEYTYPMVVNIKKQVVVARSFKYFSGLLVSAKSQKVSINRQPQFSRKWYQKRFLNQYKNHHHHRRWGHRRPKVSITIDHIGENRARNTYDVVRDGLRDSYNKAHFTVFIECTDPSNRCLHSQQWARRINALNPYRVQLGIHTLATSGRYVASAKNQEMNIINLYHIIGNIEGRNTKVPLSYHGVNAGRTVQTAIPVYLRDKVRYGRSTKTDNGHYYHRLDTRVIPNSASLQKAQQIMDINVKKRKVSTFFFHSHELYGGTPQNRLYMDIIDGIATGRYISVPYPK